MLLEYPMIQSVHVQTSARLQLPLEIYQNIILTVLLKQFYLRWDLSRVCRYYPIPKYLVKLSDQVVHTHHFNYHQWLRKWRLKKLFYNLTYERPQLFIALLEARVTNYKRTCNKHIQHKLPVFICLFCKAKPITAQGTDLCIHIATYDLKGMSW